MEQTVSFIRERLRVVSTSAPLSDICSELCDKCCAETTDGDGTGLDNVTVVLVSLNTSAAVDLIGSSVSNGSSTASPLVEDDGNSAMDSSDDGKRKQGGESPEGASGRSGKHMRAAEVTVGGAQVERR